MSDSLDAGFNRIIELQKAFTAAQASSLAFENVDINISLAYVKMMLGLIGNHLPREKFLLCYDMQNKAMGCLNAASDDDIDVDTRLQLRTSSLRWIVKLRDELLQESKKLGWDSPIGEISSKRAR